MWNNLGMISLEAGDRRKALGQFQKAVELDPQCYSCRMNVGAVALAFRDYKAAHGSFVEAAKLQPNNFEVHLMNAYSLTGLKNANEALAAFERVNKLRGNHPEALFGMGELYYGPLKDLGKAREQFQSYLAQGGNLPRKEMAEQRLQVIDMRIAAGAAQQAAEEPEEPKLRSSGGGGGEDAGDMDFLEGIEQASEEDFGADDDEMLDGEMAPEGDAALDEGDGEEAPAPAP